METRLFGEVKNASEGRLRLRKEAAVDCFLTEECLHYGKFLNNHWRLFQPAKDSFEIFLLMQAVLFAAGQSNLPLWLLKRVTSLETNACRVDLELQGKGRTDAKGCQEM